MIVDFHNTIEFYDGTGKEIYRCVILAHHYPPKKRFVTVLVRDFLMNPLKYGAEGYWIDFEVES